MRNFTMEPYPMNVPGRRRGLALIFSHSEFLTDPPRPATEVDNNRLKSVLETFGFEIKLCRNYRKQQIFNELCEVSKMDHSNNECLAIFVMTHGMPNHLAACDGYYEISSLWSYFTRTECPTLKGKPKLFFIQSCRGDQTDAGTYLKYQSANNNPQTSSDSSSVPDTQEFTYPCNYNPNKSDGPDEPDFLIAYATIRGYCAYNNISTGSWFIHQLCDILEKYGRKYDLLTLLTFVAQRVAIDFQSNTEKSNKHDKKQIPSNFITLERPLYFFPAEIENVPEELEHDD